MRKQLLVLEHHADVAPMRGHRCDVYVVEQDATLIWIKQTGDHLEQCALARARWTKQRHNLAVGHGQRGLSKQHALREPHGELTNLKHGDQLCCSWSRSPQRSQRSALRARWQARNPVRAAGNRDC